MIIRYKVVIERFVTLNGLSQGQLFVRDVYRQLTFMSQPNLKDFLHTTSCKVDFGTCSFLHVPLVKFFNKITDHAEKREVVS